MLNRTNGAGPTAWGNVALLVPARNEAARAGVFIDRVRAALAPYPVDWHAEVIDDSEDGTALRSRLARAQREIICVIDAELQHPHEILPELLAPILLGRADICVGARHRRGESSAGLKSRWPRPAGRLSGAIVRRLLPATRLTTDPESGLFAVRREVIGSLELHPRGSRVLTEVLVRGTWRTVCDVPYRFQASDAPAGAAASGRELISLWRHGRRTTASRRRVAPVHSELLLESEEKGELRMDPVRSGEPT